MKLHVYISDPEGWLNNINRDPDGDPNLYRMHHINATASKSMDEYGWVKIGSFDVSELDFNDDMIRKAAVEKVDRDEKKELADHELKLQRFNDRRQKLLAITHQPGVE